MTQTTDTDPTGSAARRYRGIRHTPPPDERFETDPPPEGTRVGARARLFRRFARHAYERRGQPVPPELAESRDPPSTLRHPRDRWAEQTKAALERDPTLLDEAREGLRKHGSDELRRALAGTGVLDHPDVLRGFAILGNEEGR